MTSCQRKEWNAWQRCFSCEPAEGDVMHSQTDPLEFLENEELLRFFHRNKTEMSLIENPHTFLSQMRDYNLLPEETYKKVSRMKSKENIRKALYEVLDCLGKKQPQNIRVFWRCVFKEAIMNHYSTLRRLRNSLLDGSFHFESQMTEMVEKEETDKSKRKQPPEDEEEEEEGEASTPVKKKRNRSSKSACNSEEEQPGPSSQLTPQKNKKSKKIRFSSPLKKGEKSDIWTWSLFKTQLPVTCGDLKGTLSKVRLANAKKCILFNKKWFNPSEFESLAGKKNAKNWKLSIRCQDTTLKSLIEDGYLKPGRYKGGSKNAKKSPVPSDILTVSDGGSDEDEEDHESSSESESSPDVTEEEGEEEEQPGTSRDGATMLFNVTCGDVAGTLHKKRFASGTCGKSVRTETSWWSPVDFVKEASTEADATWKKDILWEGKPLNDLIEAKILTIHSLLCTCKLCSKDPTDLENQKNDDECFICKSTEEEELVVCDGCPRSFHQKCHLPHVVDAMLQDGQNWLCTFCVFRNTQEWRYSDQLERTAAMSKRTSQHRLECEYLVLLLYSVDESQTFATDPRRYLEDYTPVVKTPMWLGKVAEKLQDNQYQTVGEFVSDVQLIFTNCATYNKNNPEYRAMGVRLKELFDSEFTNVFNIPIDTV